MAKQIHRSELESDQSPGPFPGTAPGKRSLTSSLAGRSQIVFRVESAEAAAVFADRFGPRDSNGVATDADAAVDRAAGSSGSPLPEHLRGRFESSLGADLSSVRIHTGSESAEASSAVGAKAYTTGQDIHFGAGHYDPSSAFGVHLIAHEVAHTVQQQGASPTRQNKLEVSTPQDGAELEADRAADAMVAGSPAAVTTAAGVARKIQRDDEVPAGPDETSYTKTRDAGANAEGYKADELDKAGAVQGGDSSGYLGASNIEDRSQAIVMINRISGYTSLLGESGDTGKLNANMNAIDALKAYMTASADQNKAQSLFAPEFIQVQLESARLGAMFKAHFAEAGVTDAGSSDGTTLAKQTMVAGTGHKKDDATKLAGVMQAQGVSSDLLKNDKLKTCKDNIRALQDSLAGFGPGMSDAVQLVLAQSKAMNAAVKLAALPPVKRDATPEQQTAAQEVEAVKNDLAAAVATTNAIISLAKEGINAIPGGAAVTGAAGTGVGLFQNAATIGAEIARTPGAAPASTDLTENMVKYFTDYDAKMAMAEGKVKAIGTEEARTAARAAVEGVRAAEAVFKAAVSAYRNNRQQFESVKAKLRKEVDTLNELVPSKTPGQPNLGAMVGLQSEASVFVARCDSALAIGQQERGEAKRATGAKDSAGGAADYQKLDLEQTFGDLVAEKRGLKYYEARKYEDISGFGGTSRGFYFKFDESQVTFSKTPKSEKNTQEAMDSSMDNKLEAMGKMRSEMSLFLSQMRTMTGI